MPNPIETSASPALAPLPAGGLAAVASYCSIILLPVFIASSSNRRKVRFALVLLACWPFHHTCVTHLRRPGVSSACHLTSSFFFTAFPSPASTISYIHADISLIAYPYAPCRFKMVGFLSAAGLVGFLSEPDPELQVFALRAANDNIDSMWTEFAAAVPQMYVAANPYPPCGKISGSVC